MSENNHPDPTGGGEGNEGAEKSAKQLKKEAARKAKEEKFKAKLEKQKAEEAEKAKKAENAEKSEKEEKKKEKKKKEVIKYEIDTPKGEKKDTNCPMPTAYSPQYVEAVWYDWWVQSGFFKPEYGGRDPSTTPDKDKFVMVIPPPNVTGTLHLGHALTNAVEDTIARWHRMNGKMVCWVPGTDHAGIATQVVVEKKLWRDRQLTRHDIGREKFVEEVWKWKIEKGDTIYRQLRSMGSSVDWDRVFFTMDDNLSQAVKEAFVSLYDKGLIYRSVRLVNWSCTLNSAISDIEVDKKEISGRTMLAVPGYEDKVEFGVLHHFAYRLADSDDEIVVATTRIETMLGDTAVAVHPLDPRYKKFHGKTVKHPFFDRQLPIVLDDFVDREFGTGAVKITPAHDPNDYECGVRHNLPFLTIFDDKGNVTADCGQFAGMRRFDARKAVFEALDKLGLIKGTTDNPMVVPTCSRSKDIIEPLLKPQWYVAVEQMCKDGIEAVEKGEMKIIPDTHIKTWNAWLGNPRDWCISRQLWWGHRIPAYFITVDDPSVPPGEDTNSDYWIVGRTEEEARERAAQKFKVAKEKISLRQDEDVLDTWFSSGLLPFSVFGWPNETSDLKEFFPGSLLETGHDILFFWVARMVMLSQALTGKLPFAEVFLHAMVRDAHGRKMSKSLGNVIDPLDVIHGVSLEDLHKRLLEGNLDQKEIVKAKEGQKKDYPHGIPECGTDALRFALVAYTTQGRDINLDVLRVEGYRNFCNKLWNATKFALSVLGENYQPEAQPSMPGPGYPMERWILSRLGLAVEACQAGFQTYQFAQATTAIYNFWLYELCDWFVEHTKPVVYGDREEDKAVSRAVLYTCLDVGLRLLHPFMPFITEELYHRLPRRPGHSAPPSIVVAPYPQPSEHSMRDAALEANIEFMQSVVSGIRKLRGQYQYSITPKTKVDVYVRCAEAEMVETLQPFLVLMTTLTTAKHFQILQDTAPPEGCAMFAVSGKCQVYIMLRGVIDLDKETARLEGEKDKRHKDLEKLQEAMQALDYTTKVPETVQEKNTEKMAKLTSEVSAITEAMDALQLLK